MTNVLFGRFGGGTTTADHVVQARAFMDGLRGGPAEAAPVAAVPQALPVAAVHDPLADALQGAAAASVEPLTVTAAPANIHVRLMPEQVNQAANQVHDVPITVVTPPAHVQVSIAQPAASIAPEVGAPAPAGQAFGNVVADVRSRLTRFRDAMPTPTAFGSASAARTTPTAAAQAAAHVVDDVVKTAAQGTTTFADRLLAVARNATKL